MQLGNWSSATHQFTMGLQESSPLSPVIYGVYTKGMAYLNENGLSRVLTLADDGLIYKTTVDTQEADKYVQQQLENVSQWCQDTRSLINPNKAQALWCTLDNKTAGKAITSSHI